MKLTILGLGEAGSLIAKGLQNQGVEVLAYDPKNPRNPAVPVTESATSAVADADVVFSLNSATASVKVAREVAGSIKPGAIFCDLNTGTPALKKQLSQMFPEKCFVDVAVMKPVPGLEERVPMSASGPGAKKFLQLFKHLDMDLTFVSEIAGEAAARKLIRSIMAKGMAAVLIDALWAAKSMGLEEWAIEEIRREFDSSSSKTVKRYLDGTQQHSKRRSVEMADVLEMLSDSGYESTMVRGVELTLSRVIHGVRVPFAEI